jgi:hypothetical protein
MKQSTSSIAEIKGKEIINYQSKIMILHFFNEVREDERTIRVSKYLENQNQLKKGTTSICFELCFG